MVWTSALSSRCQSFLKKLFGWVGLNAHKHPCPYISLGVFITVCSAFGMLNFTFEGEGVRLYVPTDSEVYKEYERTIEYFGEFATFGILLVGDKNGDNLLTPDGLDKLYEMYKYPMYNLSAESSGRVWDFSDLCERKYPGYPYCSSQESNLFVLWQENPDNWQTQDDIDAAIETAFGQELLSFLMGGLMYDDDGSTIIGGNYLRMTYIMSATTNDTIYDANYEWMFEFVEYWSADDTPIPSDYSISYFTSRSITDEIGRVVSSDAQVYLAAILTMFVYLAFTLGDFTCLGARPWLAVVTIFVMIMALITSYGIGCAMGYPMTSLVFLIPYLLLGVGVDDEIIIVEAVDREQEVIGDQEAGGERFEKALRDCGLSISLTSFCSVMAFAIGSTVTMPGVTSFCVYAALGFFANYVLQFLVFLPILALDERRKQARRNFCCQCIKYAPIEKPNSTNPDPEKVDESERCSFGVSTILKTCVVPLLSNQIYRIIIIVVFSGLGVASVISLSYLDTTSDTTRLVPDDSYLVTYLDEYEDAFSGEAFAEISVILENLDFSDSDVRSNIHSLLDDYNNYTSNIARIVGTVDNWLDSFEEFIYNTINLTENEFDQLSQDDFYVYLKLFADDTDYAEWDDEIIYDDFDNPTQIDATKFYMNFAKPDTLREQWPMRQSLKNLLEDHLGSNKGYVFEETYPFSYFEWTVVNLTIRNIISASIGVYVILLLLMDLRMATFIILVVVMIDFDLFGWIAITGLSLDSLAFLQLVMAVGLTVDYVIHITHAIADARPPDGCDPNEAFNEKLKIAMMDMGVGVAKGAWTTFLGAIPLVFSQSEAFRRFFYLFAGIIIVALAHGMFFVPAVMAQLNFLYSGIEHASEVADKKIEKPNYDPKDIRDKMTESNANHQDQDQEKNKGKSTDTNGSATTDGESVNTNVEMTNNKNDVSSAPVDPTDTNAVR